MTYLTTHTYGGVIGAGVPVKELGKGGNGDNGGGKKGSLNKKKRKKGDQRFTQLAAGRTQPSASGAKAGSRAKLLEGKNRKQKKGHIGKKLKEKGFSATSL